MSVYKTGWMILNKLTFSLIVEIVAFHRPLLHDCMLHICSKNHNWFFWPPLCSPEVSVNEAKFCLMEDMKWNQNPKFLSHIKIPPQVWTWGSSVHRMGRISAMYSWRFHLLLLLVWRIRDEGSCLNVYLRQEQTNIKLKYVTPLLRC